MDIIEPAVIECAFLEDMTEQIGAPVTEAKFLQDAVIVDDDGKCVINCSDGKAVVLRLVIGGCGKLFSIESELMENTNYDVAGLIAAAYNDDPQKEIYTITWGNRSGYDLPT